MALTSSSSGTSMSTSDMNQSSGTVLSPPITPTNGQSLTPMGHIRVPSAHDNNHTNFSTSPATSTSPGFDWKYWGTIGGTALFAVIATYWITQKFRKKRRSAREDDDRRRASDITSASELSEVSESDVDDRRRRRRAKDRKAKRTLANAVAAATAGAAAAAAASAATSHQHHQQQHQQAYRSDRSENGSRVTLPPSYDDRRGSMTSIDSSHPIGKSRPAVPDDEPTSPTMSLSSSLNSRSGMDAGVSRSPIGTTTPANSRASRTPIGGAPGGPGSLTGSGSNSNSGVLVSSAHGAHGYAQQQHQPHHVSPTTSATAAGRRSFADERFSPDEGDLIERLIHSRTRLEHQGTQSLDASDHHGHHTTRYSESNEVNDLLHIIHNMDLRRCGVRLRQKAAEWLMTLKALAGAQARDDEEFKRVIRDSREMWRAWEILDYPVDDDPAQQTAFDMLRVDVALRMHDHYRMAPIFDRLTAKGVAALSYEALQVTFAYAPVLGRWSLTRQLGDQIMHAAPARMQELHNNAAQSSEVPDFMMLYELAEDEAKRGDWPLEAMGWDRYSVIGLHLKLRHVEPEEPIDERFAVFRSGEWIHTQFEKAELHRMGAFALLIPADGGQLVGPANQQRMRLAGVRDLDNGSTVREDYDLQKAAEHGAWIGTYTFLQTDTIDGNISSVKVTFEVALQLVLTLSFEHPATGPVVASTSPPPLGAGGRALPASSSASSAAVSRAATTAAAAAPPSLTSSPPLLSSSATSSSSSSNDNNSGVLVAPVARYHHQHHPQHIQSTGNTTSSPAVSATAAAASSSSSSSAPVRSISPIFSSRHTGASSSSNSNVRH